MAEDGERGEMREGEMRKEGEGGPRRDEIWTALRWCRIATVKG